MKLKKITLEEFRSDVEKYVDRTYILKNINSCTKMEEITMADAILVRVDGNEQKEKKKKQVQYYTKKPNYNIDKGKIVALYKAGWMYKDIMQECDCSVQAVLRTLEKAGVEKNRRRKNGN